VRHVGIVVALPIEARALGRARRRPDGLVALASDALLAVSGMGIRAAASRAGMLVAAGADALMSFGLAGGLDPVLAPGAILLASEVISAEGPSLTTTPAWREQIAAALAAHRPLVQGRLLTSSRVLGTVAEKAEAFGRTRAAAVDMESFGVAQVAEAHRLPFMAVRVIVDAAPDTLPRVLSRGADPVGQVSFSRLVGGLALAPADVPALVRLARRYGKARRSMRAVAASGALTALAETA
jgi:adenosylhomocysteine nucleosidase